MTGEQQATKTQWADAVKTIPTCYFFYILSSDLTNFAR